MLDTAKYHWSKVSYDDIYLNNTCFDLQQCIEFALKYILEMSGISYPRTHDIGKLIELLRTRSAVIAKIYAHHSEYTRWEVSARYSQNFVAIRGDILECFALSEELIKNADTLVKPAGIPADALQWCKEQAPPALHEASDEDLWKYMSEVYYAYHPKE